MYSRYVDVETNGDHLMKPFQDDAFMMGTFGVVSGSVVGTGIGCDSI